MDEIQWTKTESESPDEKREVRAISESGHEGSYWLYRGLWFTSEDLALYIYFMPVLWRYA